MTDREQLTKTILDTIREVLIEKGLTPSNLSLETHLDAIKGIESLDWAVIVVRLEDSTGVDPFSQGLSRELRTANDLVEIYQSQLSP